MIGTSIGTPLNELLYTDGGVSGSVLMVVKPEQPLYAPSPTEVTVSGSVTERSWLHPLKAYLLTAVKPTGNVALSRLSQS